jgi:hypothetical protein
MLCRVVFLFRMLNMHFPPCISCSNTQSRVCAVQSFALGETHKDRNGYLFIFCSSSVIFSFVGNEDRDVDSHQVRTQNPKPHPFKHILTINDMASGQGSLSKECSTVATVHLKFSTGIRIKIAPHMYLICIKPIFNESV